MFIGVPHTGPLVHAIVPCWQGLPGGVQLEFGVQARHAPLPSHTPPETAVVWHEAPAGAGAFWSVQVIVPPAHEVTLPVWQGLLAGEHALPTVHALHAPAVQYCPVPHGVPSGALIATLQTACPVLQSIVFLTHGLAMSVQSAPAVQTPQLPAWQTDVLPVPQGVPSARLAVFMHVPPASVHAKVPVWHSAGAHNAPDTQAWPLPTALAPASLVAASPLTVASSSAADPSGVDASGLGGVRS